MRRIVLTIAAIAIFSPPAALANKTALDLLNSPEFFALPEFSQIGRLSDVDPNFAGLSNGAQRLVLSRYGKPFAVKRQVREIEQQAIADQRPRSTAPTAPMEKPELPTKWLLAGTLAVIAIAVGINAPSALRLIKSKLGGMVSPRQGTPIAEFAFTKFDYGVFSIVAIVIASRLMIDQSYWIQQHAMRFTFTCVFAGFGVCLGRRAF